MAENKNKLLVLIAGKQYPLVAEDPVEHLQNIADIVDKQMSGILQANSALSNEKAAVLTALQLADQLVKLNKEYDQLMADLDSLTN